MSDFKKAFKEGSKRAGLRTYRQVVEHGAFYGGVIAFLVWDPFKLWARLLVGIACLLVYGMIASSTRLGRWMQQGESKGHPPLPTARLASRKRYPRWVAE
jgi:hypothetical protein